MSHCSGQHRNSQAPQRASTERDLCASKRQTPVGNLAAIVLILSCYFCYFAREYIKTPAAWQAGTKNFKHRDSFNHDKCSFVQLGMVPKLSRSEKPCDVRSLIINAILHGRTCLEAKQLQLPNYTFSESRARKNATKQKKLSICFFFILRQTSSETL